MRSLEILLAWSAYFALHSLLAASSVKAGFSRRWPRCAPAYRVAFNAIALLTLVPVLWLVYRADGPWLWQWRGAWAWVANGGAALALLALLQSTRGYDMGEFLGLRQLGEAGGEAAQTFTVSFLHRFVRHPWYCIGLVLIWTRDMNEPLLVSALATTAYLIAGSRLEEQKLIETWGDTYRSYRRRVPGLLPLPWKTLGTAEAAALARSARRQPPPAPP